MSRYLINGFTLDPKQRVIHGPTGEQAIRPKTLALLLFLIEHRHVICSKDTLLEKVWEDVHVNDGVIFSLCAKFVNCLATRPFCKTFLAKVIN